MSGQKPAKESLHVELQGLLATAHGDMKEAAEKIAKAVDKLIEKNTNENKKQLETVLFQAMTIPNSSSFKTADKKLQEAMRAILDLAKECLATTGELPILTRFNNDLKQRKKELKDRIKKLEQEAQHPTISPGKRF